MSNKRSNMIHVQKEEDNRTTVQLQSENTNNDTEQLQANPKYKDFLFRFVFREKADLLALYNAVNGTSYENEDDLTITTLEDVVYIGVKNDVSFIMNDILNLYEHQSSFNPNMPLRGLIYFSSLYQAHIKKHELNQYGTAILQLPPPRYIIFYNGTAHKEDKIELKLTDSFPEHLREKSCLQVTAMMYNINIGHNQELLSQCKKLGEYATFIDKVRSFLSAGMESTQAIDMAVKWSIEHDVLKEILEKNRSEVADLLLTEYNAEEQRKLDRRDARAEGETIGEARGITIGEARGITIGETRGITKGKVEAVEKVMNEFSTTLEKACSVIGITVETYQNYKENL